MKPLAIDLFCGLGGFSAAAMSEGYRCVGFDIERHQYGNQQYPAQLVLQDVLTIHGSQFRDADFIWASPPCQQYSWLAMPWSRSTDPNNSKAAKALRKKWETEGPDNRLFDACFRIQREAIEATGEPCPKCCHLAMYTISTLCSHCNCTGRVNTRYIPMIVENVRGAQEWVGTAKANYGSFFLWGDVGMVGGRVVAGDARFGAFTVPAKRGRKNAGGSWFAVANNTESGHSKNPVHELTGHKAGHPERSYRNGHKSTAHLTNPAEHQCEADNGTKIGGDWFSDPNSTCRKHGSRSSARKAASAQIAKIPEPLARYIARAFRPAGSEAA